LDLKLGRLNTHFDTSCPLKCISTPVRRELIASAVRVLKKGSINWDIMGALVAFLVHNKPQFDPERRENPVSLLMMELGVQEDTGSDIEEPDEDRCC